MYSVFLTKKASKQLDKLPDSTRGKVLEAIKRLNDFPHNLDVRKIAGFRSFYRIRVGKYRILIHLEGNTLVVVEILPRSKAYKRF